MKIIQWAIVFFSPLIYSAHYYLLPKESPFSEEGRQWVSAGLWFHFLREGGLHSKKGGEINV